MDFAYTEEQEAVRELARQIFQDRADHEHLRAIESSEDGIDRELWKALAEANLLGVALPESVGGSGMGLEELAIVLEEQGRALAQVPIVAGVVCAAMPLAEFGSDAQRSRWVAPLVAGEVLLTAALYEPGQADIAKPRLRARREGSGWRLDGEKTCVPIAHLADRILVSARTDGDSVGLFLVDPKAKGVAREPQRATNHEPQAHVRLDGVAVAQGDVLGDASRGAAILRWIEARALLALSALQLGVASEALRRTAEYTTSRKQFGRSIATFQSVSLRAADGYIAVEAMRSTLWQAAWRLDANLSADRELAAAKWWACRGGHEVVHTAQHLHGGTGADIDYPIHRFFLWAKQIESTFGGASWQLARLGGMIARGEGTQSYL